MIERIYNSENPATWLKPGEKLNCGKYDISWMYIIFSDVDGSPGFKVDSNGGIWSCWESKSNNGRGGSSFLTGNWHQVPVSLAGDGYHRVGIKDFIGNKICRYVHDLVLNNVYKKRPDNPRKCMARHLDGNKSNNRLANLLWGTVAENHADKVRHGTSNRGSRHPMSKLMESDIFEIVKLHEAGISGASISKKYHVSGATVSLILNGKRWPHVTSAVRQ